MKPYIKYALLLSAVAVAGGGVAMAMVARAPQPNAAAATVAAAQPYTARARGSRGGGKFFAQYDLNGDGTVTRAEFDRAVAQQFADAAGASASTMSEAQFIASRTKDLRQRTDQIFHRDDWNGDGKLSLEEYATPERTRFEYADRDGTGIITCGSRSRATRSSEPVTAGGSRGFGAVTRGSGGGRGAICKADDLNHDGQVTRDEFDRATAQEFAAAATGGALTPDGFYAIVAGHVKDSAVHMFARLDKNHDGKLDRDEFAATQIRYFARLDRNNDGVVTRDEAYSQRRVSADGNGKPRRT